MTSGSASGLSDLQHSILSHTEQGGRGAIKGEESGDSWGWGLRLSHQQKELEETVACSRCGADDVFWMFLIILVLEYSSTLGLKSDAATRFVWSKRSRGV